MQPSVLPATGDPLQSETMDEQLPDSVTVKGAAVRYGTTGSGPDILLVHGNAANHWWWRDYVAALEPHWRVTTMEFSGHGESDRRDAYSPTLWTEELDAVAAATGAKSLVVVGHSMGARTALSWAGERQPAALRGLVIFDMGLRPPGEFRESSPTRDPMRVYETREQAIARFRLYPPQPAPAGDIIEYIASHSVRHDPDGWRFKHDTGILGLFDDVASDAAARRVIAPITFAYGARSALANAHYAEHLRAVVPAPTEIIRFEDVHHHLVLEDPERCIQVIEVAARKYFGL